MYRLKRFSTHSAYSNYISQKEVFNNPQRFIGYCKREKEIHFYIPEEADPPASLYFWWSGEDEPISGKWKDRIRGAEWIITGGTWSSENGWYQFLNPTTAVQWASYTGTVPNFGYHWEVCLDCEVLYPGSSSSVLMDFSSVGGVGTNKSGFSISYYPSGVWRSNAKLYGNGSASTYQPGYVSDLLETNVWYSRTVSLGVRSSNTTGKDEMYYIIPGVGESKTATPFTPVQVTPDGCGSPYWWIGRGWINQSGEYSATNYRTSIRVKDIKIYTHLENYET